MTLRDQLSHARVVVMCGPGGVGKTTCAAAIALASASSARRVLLLTIDPARRLADTLGIVDGGVAGSEVSADGVDVHVVMLDAPRQWDALIQRYAPDEETAQRIIKSPLYRSITGRFVHGHDYIAMEMLYDAATSGEWDLIVIDTPPTRHAVDFLDAPTRMADFFSSRLLKWLVAPGGTSVTSVAAKAFSAVAQRILGGQFLADIADFFGALATLSTGFVERGRAVAQLLIDDATTYVVVTTTEEFPRDEARHFTAEVRARGGHLAAWIVNQVYAPVGEGETQWARSSDALRDSITAAARRERGRIEKDELAIMQLATEAPVAVGYRRDDMSGSVSELVLFGRDLLDSELTGQ
jgi:anion-transporting  ArsA/GET3 family ATPase